MAANGWKKVRRRIKEVLGIPPDWSGENDGIQPKKKRRTLSEVRKKQGEGFWQADIGD